MQTATANLIPADHASFWEDARWWIEQVLNVFGYPAELLTMRERTGPAARLQNWLTEIELLVRRLVIAAALALDLPAPAASTRGARPAAKPAPPAPAESTEDKTLAPAWINFFPPPSSPTKSKRSSGRSSGGVMRPKPQRTIEDERAASHRLMFGPFPDSPDPFIINKHRHTASRRPAARSTRADTSLLPMPAFRLVSVARHSRKLEAVMNVLADPGRAILGCARRFAREPELVIAADRTTSLDKPKSLVGALGDTIDLVDNAAYAWRRRQSSPAGAPDPNPDPYEEPG